MTQRNTLRAISDGLGLHPNTMGVLFNRADHRNQDRPQPVEYIGPSQGVPVYDVQEVEAWYAARSIEPKPHRGPDKRPRKKRVS